MAKKKEPTDKQANIQKRARKKAKKKGTHVVEELMKVEKKGKKKGRKAAKKIGRVGASAYVTYAKNGKKRKSQYDTLKKVLKS